MTDFIQVVTTTDSREDADRIARALVEQRVAGASRSWGRSPAPIAGKVRLRRPRSGFA
jgi:hypothetical protein